MVTLSWDCKEVEDQILKTSLKKVKKDEVLPNDLNSQHFLSHKTITQMKSRDTDTIFTGLARVRIRQKSE